MTNQLALFDSIADPAAEVVERPRPWTVCGHAEPVLPDWYETNTFHRCGPDEWKQPDGYNNFISRKFWNGTQWCLDENDQRAAPLGTTYPGSPRDRWRLEVKPYIPKRYIFNVEVTEEEWERHHNWWKK